jgi:general stress protein YciG
MPNNNPHGHNQYTKPELRSQKSKKSSPQPNQSGSTDAPGGTDTTQQSDNEKSAGTDHSTAASTTHTPGMHSASVSHMPVTQDQTPTPAAAGTPGGAPPSQSSGTSRRGFASMDAAMQREIASKGGHSQGRENNPGNFANDREKAREAGRKGGEAHGHR